MKAASAMNAALLALLPSAAIAQQSSCGPAPSGSIQPSLASGYRMQVVATGLARPRGILFDGDGNLLVVEQSRGVISAHTLNESNGCVSVGTSSDVTSALSLNHGIELSADGRTLYASSSDNVYSWDYDASAKTVSNRATRITNMDNADHSTRTILLSQNVPGMMVVSRGSASNIDIAAADVTTGHSQIRAFNLDNYTGDPYDFVTDGLRLGWGLRNDVGVAEHPGNGGIYSVENSADQVSRMGVRVSEDNPGESLHFFGSLSGPRNAAQGAFFGYPWCFPAWKVEDLPNNGNLSVGSLFAVDANSALNNENQTDRFCAQQVPPRLVFQAHMAPLDLKFNNSGREAWITFHGSWNRAVPVGYKLSVVAFTEDGEPVDDPQSKTAARDIFANTDESRCPSNCFRPVGIAFDSQGRIFMSSDTSGEIYLISRESDAQAPSPTPSETPNSAHNIKPSFWHGWAGLLYLLALGALAI